VNELINLAGVLQGVLEACLLIAILSIGGEGLKRLGRILRLQENIYEETMWANLIRLKQLQQARKQVEQPNLKVIEVENNKIRL